jgi:ABC-2 type transport system permease protein
VNHSESTARVISARKTLRQQLGEIWAYRDLLVRLVRKELQVKYKNSVLGFVWSMLNPALYLVVFYVVFQLILGSGIPNYAIFLLSGLLAWNLFSTAVAAGTASITGNGSLVGKVWFPREVLPLAAVGAALVHLALQAGVLLAALAVLRHGVSWPHLIAVPLALVVLLALASGLALLFAAGNVYLRDVQHLVELALLAWFWMTPIVYQHPFVADRLAGKSYAWIQWLNPLTTIVLTFQRGIYAVTDAAGGKALGGRPLAGAAGDGPLRILPHDMDVSWYLTHLGPVAVVSVVVLFLGLVVFGRLEGNFAEEL